MIASSVHTPPINTETASPATTDREPVDTAAIAAAILETIAYRMRLSQVEIAQAIARSSWTTIGQMIEREFTGSYRGYYPRCSMAIRDEAVIAQAFDLLAIGFDDPRRAVRSDAWMPPALPAGGRSHG